MSTWQDEYLTRVLDKWVLDKKTTCWQNQRDLSNVRGRSSILCRNRMFTQCTYDFVIVTWGLKLAPMNIDVDFGGVNPGSPPIIEVGGQRYPFAPQKSRWNLLKILKLLLKQRLKCYRKYQNENSYFNYLHLIIFTVFKTLLRAKEHAVSCLLIHSFITEIYIAPLQGYYSEAFTTLARLKRRVLRLE